MAKVNAPLLAFNRGEVSKIALARIDVAKMQLAAQCQVNWLPFVLGPMMLRPGLALVGETASDNACELVDFIYSRTDTAMIELTASLLRVRINDVLVSRPAVSTAVGDPNMSGSGSWSTADTTAGCTATVTGAVATLNCPARGGLSRIKQTLTIAGGDQNVEHGLRVTITNGPVTLRAGTAAGLSDVISQTVLDTGTHSLAFTPATGSVFLQIESTDARAKTLTQVTIDAAGALTLPTPWASGTLRWTQANDTIYVAQYGGQQYKIERRGTRPGARGWSVVKYRSDNGPFLETPSIAANLTPSVYYGNGTLTSDRAYFTSAHVGALFRVFGPGQVNQAVLGAGGAFTDPIRVSGVGNDRVFGWTVAGTWTGTLSLQRSLVGPDSGFTVVATQTTNSTFDVDDTATLNNVVAWYRVGFPTAADYTSGAATVYFGQNSAGGGGAKPGKDHGAASGSGGRYGICRVTAFTSPTLVSIEILDDFSTLTPSMIWQEAAWSDAQGWPSSVCINEGRLWWFGAPAMPICGSQEPSFFTGFAEEDQYGETLGDAGAILEGFGEGPNDRINWGLPLSPRLMAGREGSIASIRSSSFDTPLTPTDFAVKDCSQQSAGRVAALRVGKRGVFVDGSTRKVYELFFSPQSADFDDRDLTRFNVDIGAPGLDVDTAKATQPDTLLYFVRRDGQCAVLLYDPADEVEAWWRIMTLGNIENVRVLPRAEGGDDRVYFVVKRTINGQTKRFIEQLSQRSENAGGLDHRGLDSHLAFTSGGPFTSVTAGHLPSTLVTVWADGASRGTFTTDAGGVVTLGASYNQVIVGLAGAQVSQASDAGNLTGMTGLSAYNGIPGEFFADQQPSSRLVHIGSLTPSGGAVTLPNGMKSSKIVGFFGFMAPFMSAKLAYGAQMGTPLARTKKIDHVGLVMFDAHAQGVTYGQSIDQLDALPQYEAGGAVDPAGIWSEFDEPPIELNGDWSTDARLCLLGQAPFPCKIGGLAVSQKTHG